MNWMWPPPLPFEDNHVVHDPKESEEPPSDSRAGLNAPPAPQTQYPGTAPRQHLKAAHSGFLFSWGRRALVLFHDIGGMFFMAVQLARLTSLLQVDGRETLRHFHRFSFGSLPVILGGSVIVGGLVAMQGLGYLSRYNATEVFGWAAGLSSFREVGPLLLGLTIAARLGSKNTAELITMRSRERLDSLTALGLNVDVVVFAPRFWSITFTTIVAFPICGMTILATSFILAGLIGDQNIFVSWHSFTAYLGYKEVLQGLLRMGLFGTWVGLCSCYFSCHRAERDARSIGQSVFASSVASMTGVVTLNLYLSFLAGA